ncbi:hypothetical protein Poli38472_006887 [Pythium oligandrum]|uniref:Ricin B lectin domain-containing protein n=1 Tax=Pythium oligandrum TaxID=41045 RepID=A0A8K1C6D6_PYTOL|nr:hypothetical protein Poli38472_006887 [Pythium oligandrum]|eukprot:TMW56877.1 hypothetical protein Poli38472_006887 [Pythium oligandrum]
MNQIFAWDAGMKRLRSYKKNLCLDDGGGATGASTKFVLWNCDAKNPNQDFVFDKSTLLFRQPNKPGLCMDDGGCNSSGQTKLVLWTCDVYNQNQHFEFVLTSPPLTPAPVPTIQPTFVPAPVPTGPVTFGPAPVPTNPSSDEPAPVPTGPVTFEPAPVPTPQPTFLPLTLEPDQNSTGSLGDLVDGDWNLLAPSHLTIGEVNSDSSDEITSAEIFKYLIGIKNQAEQKYKSTMYKYRRTLKCATAGLSALSKDVVNADEYHGLVTWMYKHCDEGYTDQPEKRENESGSSSSGPKVHTYMTKLEFYYAIKDHFANERSDLLGVAEAARLRSGIATAERMKLLSCIEEASSRFGRYKEYELPEHFQNAIKWVKEDCMNL